MAGDAKYNISGGQQGAVGDNATAHHITQNQGGSQGAEPLDLSALADQLARLHEAAQSRASDPDHKASVAYIEGAKEAAAKGDESKALAYLKSAGRWAWEIATDIGAKLAAEIIKGQIGLG